VTTCDTNADVAAIRRLPNKCKFLL